MTTSTKSPFKNLALTYGGLLGLFSILLSVIVYSLGSFMEKPLWSTLAITFVGFGITYYAILQYRSKLGGFISLGQAMKLGIAVSVISGIIAVLSNHVFITYLEPDTIDQMLEAARMKFEEQGLADDQIEMGLSMSKKFMSPFMMAATGVLASIFTGAIYSLICGLILQKKDPANY